MRGRASQWAIARAGRLLGRRFRRGWRRLPAPARRRWIATLAAGLAAVTALTIALSRLGATLEARGALAGEPRVLAWIGRINPLSPGWAVWAESLVNPVLLVPLLAVAAAFTIWLGCPLRALSFPATLLVAAPVASGGWLVWHRDRPPMTGGLALPSAVFHAFPSGHVAVAIGVYGLLAYLWARGSGSRIERALAAAAALLATAAVALARLALGAHWPTDILGGVVVGAAWLGVLIGALRGAER